MCEKIHWSLAGTGVGLKSCHVDDIINAGDGIRWVEILLEQHLFNGGAALHDLERLRCNYPVTLHGTGLALGSFAPLDMDYLARLKQMANNLEVSWLSDHVSFGSLGQFFSHELLPLPYTEEALDHITARISQVQDYLGRRILLENPACYLGFNHSTISEGEFLAEMAQRADCYLLLDLNNCYVTQYNLGIDAQHTLAQLPARRVREIHLAGFDDHDTYLLDGHNTPVHEPVWTLYEQAQQQFTATPTLIEWEHDIPPLSVILGEVSRAQHIMQQAIKTRRPY
ncbi:DUF692 domain-containing protein [Marinobacterium rhizophilum]|uniref:MNIO family bufferin maturase n=1 Tax=Marinobacterium rhizophilum TaxID=420402 RepID=UPI000381644B|nr:DUF692 domain-containing protein [Marinobacterium rhizophilum]